MHHRFVKRRTKKNIRKDKTRTHRFILTTSKLKWIFILNNNNKNHLKLHKRRRQPTPRLSLAAPKSEKIAKFQKNHKIAKNRKKSQKIAKIEKIPQKWKKPKKSPENSQISNKETPLARYVRDFATFSQIFAFFHFLPKSRKTLKICEK